MSTSVRSHRKSPRKNLSPLSTIAPSRPWPSSNATFYSAAAHTEARASPPQRAFQYGHTASTRPSPALTPKASSRPSSPYSAPATRPSCPSPGARSAACPYPTEPAPSPQANRTSRHTWRMLGLAWPQTAPQAIGRLSRRIRPRASISRMAASCLEQSTIACVLSGTRLRRIFWRILAQMVPPVQAMEASACRLPPRLAPRTWACSRSLFLRCARSRPLCLFSRLDDDATGSSDYETGFWLILFCWIVARGGWGLPLFWAKIFWNCALFSLIWKVPYYCWIGYLHVRRLRLCMLCYLRLVVYRPYF